MERDVQRLKTKDIILIIEACSKYNVSEFKFEELLLQFREASHPEKIDEFPITPAAIPEGEDRDLIEEKERVENLLIEDPLEMERRIADGELVDEI